LERKGKTRYLFIKMRAYGGSIGRRRHENTDTLFRDPFHNDYVKIMESKAYRRLSYKTQVFSRPLNPHIRTRLIHTNEVVNLSTAIAEQLGLNVNLCRAIAAGHDLGHVPYGHTGEKVLSDFANKKIRHPALGVIIAQEIERKAKGLNLCFETLEGMLVHSLGEGDFYINPEQPDEYSVVMIADKMAYVFADFNDVKRQKSLHPDLPPELDLGELQRDKVKNVVRALVYESAEKNRVSFSDSEVAQKFWALKKFMYDEVYNEVDWRIHNQILKRTCEYFDSQEEFADLDPVLLVALLTDLETNYLWDRYFSRHLDPKVSDIKTMGVFEIIPHIRGKEIDLSQPDLSWKDKAHTDNHQIRTQII